MLALRNLEYIYAYMYKNTLESLVGNDFSEIKVKVIKIISKDIHFLLLRLPWALQEPDWNASQSAPILNTLWIKKSLWEKYVNTKRSEKVQIISTTRAFKIKIWKITTTYFKNNNLLRAGRWLCHWQFFRLKWRLLRKSPCPWKQRAAANTFPLPLGPPAFPPRLENR